jgi:ElaB/YqjD/DUF883 family membrane-anchored ribosome-binding protein
MTIEGDEVGLTSVEISKMSQQEQANLTVQIKDIMTKKKIIMERYSKLNMATYEDFIREMDSLVSNVDQFVSEFRFQAIQKIDAKNNKVINAEQGKVPRNPYTDAVKLSEDSIKNLISIITWLNISLDIIYEAWEKLVNMITEYKGVQHDKIKSDLEKENRENLLKKQGEMFENHIRITREQTDETIKKLREQLDDERKHINELKRTLPKNHEIENRGQSSTQESLDKLQRLKKELEDKEDE